MSLDVPGPGTATTSIQIQRDMVSVTSGFPNIKWVKVRLFIVSVSDLKAICRRRTRANGQLADLTHVSLRADRAEDRSLACQTLERTSHSSGTFLWSDIRWRVWNFQLAQGNFSEKVLSVRCERGWSTRPLRVNHRFDLGQGQWFL